MGAVSPRTKCPPIIGFFSPNTKRAVNLSLAPSSQRNQIKQEFLSNHDWKKVEMKNHKKMRPHVPAYQIFGASAEKPNINQFGSHFDSGVTQQQESLVETGPTASIFMPSSSIEKVTTGPHHSLYETMGETSIGDQYRDHLTVQDSLVTDNLGQDSIQSSAPKEKL